ncbi:unnamed protein product [Enterobius vermicularis]|uniref:Kinesin motor domain-containing protein n=1 Tax=Enterobius vermicularis TaxID=51028 RepID=A0A0N4VIX6_ENTVE|nr:unnamed protein product [Enterobius vermicularis]
MTSIDSLLSEPLGSRLDSVVNTQRHSAETDPTTSKLKRSPAMYLANEEQRQANINGIEPQSQFKLRQIDIAGKTAGGTFGHTINEASSLYSCLLPPNAVSA